MGTPERKAVMTRRTWSIRSRILALVLPPTLMFVAFWLAGSIAGGAAARSLLDSADARDGVLDPGAAVVTELQRERHLTAETMAGPEKATTKLDEQRSRTDTAVTAYRRKATAVDSLSDRAAQRVSESVAAFDGLRTTRSAVDSDRSATLAAYDGMVDAVFRVHQPLMELDDHEATRLLRASVHLAQAREQLSRADALLTLGRFTPTGQAEFAQLTGARRQLLLDAAAELDGALRTRYAELSMSTELISLETLENRLASAGQLDPAGWTARRDAADERLRRFQDTLDDALADRTGTVVALWWWRFGLTTVIGLLAVVLTVVVTVRVGSSLIRRLRGLRNAANDLADDRLPSLVRRLRAGEEVDVAVEAPELEFGRDEIGEVGHAFSAAQRTAVESAIQEARARAGIDKAFLIISRRSQTLLNRQLAVLDRMERRTEDPDELADLFRVDHLATRMRRHAEDLVVLAGATPSHGLRDPAPLIDVVRGAVSEVEDYTRVTVGAVPGSSVAGHAVTDLIHLLAGLIENATSFSPRATTVTVAGQVLPNGLAVEVEDRGIGMSESALAEANARLREPPDFDPADSARLGLFVVARLAARLGAQVTLQNSPFGGVTAVVLVPLDLIAAGPSADEDPGLRRGAPAREPSFAEAPPEPPADSPVADGLPQRRRRASPRVKEPEPDEPQPERTPEQTRAMMSAFQSASIRGRQDAATTPQPDKET